jgi:hypothetical protein
MQRKIYNIVPWDVKFARIQGGFNAMIDVRTTRSPHHVDYNSESEITYIPGGWLALSRKGSIREMIVT